MLADQYGGIESVIAHPLMTATNLCINKLSSALQEGTPGMLILFALLTPINMPGALYMIESMTHLPQDQYLCTGLDMYVSKEPDLMSSMALVHSRIRRVVYWEEDNAEGCLGSKAKIHLIKSLNHHFEVFRGSCVS